jgi:hypothetical protein
MNTSGFAPEYQRALILFWFSSGYVKLLGLVNTTGVQRGLNTGLITCCNAKGSFNTFFLREYVRVFIQRKVQVN